MRGCYFALTPGDPPHILGDPAAAYFADARRQAHDPARKLLADSLDARHLQTR